MYICDICNIVVGPNIPSNTVILETRDVTYPARPKDGDPGGVGYEIAKEARVCEPCKIKGE